MAKTAKLKKSTKPPSAHSRAFRRASSPSLNLDKSLTSLTSLKPPSRSRLDSLGAHASAGISKSQKKKGGKILKRKQKQRNQLGKEKAEAVMEKMEKKFEQAGGRREGLKGRNADWDELNEKIAGKKEKRAMRIDTRPQEDDGWEDKEMAATGAFSAEKNGVGGSNGVDTGGFTEDELS